MCGCRWVLSSLSESSGNPGFYDSAPMLTMLCPGLLAAHLRPLDFLGLCGAGM